MLWVRADYADRLAIASAAISALLPWNVTYSPDVAGGALLFVRFPFFQVQFLFGFSIPGVDSPVLRDTLSALAFQAGRPLELAYLAWAVGAGILALALVQAVAIYLARKPSEEQRVDPIRLMGALLVAAAVVLTVATYLVLTRGFGGVPIPVGVVFLYALGGILLAVERRGSSSDAA